MATHAKKDSTSATAELLNWLVPGIVTVLNTPVSHFNSPFFGKLFDLAKLGPINEKIARRLCDSTANMVKSRLAADLATLRSEGTVFTLTADEWTWQRKRFVGVTLHSSVNIPHFNARSVEIMSRFRERATATHLHEVLLDNLTELNLSIGDIKGITTDAASVMRRVGDLLAASAGSDQFYHQLCFAHGLHLAVLDTLKVTTHTAPAEWDLVDVQADGEEQPDDELERVSPEYCSSSGSLVNAVREECQKFQRSPAMNDELQKLALAAGCQVKLVVDIRIRWSSTLRMLQNFLKNENPLKEFYGATRDVAGLFPFTDRDLKKIKHVAAALSHVEECTRRLSLADATLRSADLALQAMIMKLESEHGKFAASLRKNICIRLLQRRGVASRLSRLTRKKGAETELDTWLDDVREQVVAAGQEAVYKTFLPPGDLAAEISKFQSETAVEEDPPEHDARSEGPKDFYEIYLNRDEDEMDCTPSSQETIQRQGVKSLPEVLVATLDTLQPTSVPAERIFSKARSARRYNQESQNDERFGSYIFLKDYITKSQEWLEAMGAEMNSMTALNVWTLTTPPTGRRSLGCRLVFKIKRNAEGKIFDVASASLSAKIEEELYMDQPEGFHDDTLRVCRLYKALYGSRQALRCFHMKTKSILLGLGLGQCLAEPCVFYGDNVDRLMPCSTPADRDKYSLDETEELEDIPYRELIGSLKYLQLGTRPDISFIVGYLSRFLEHATHNKEEVV
ncbi:uncharacterized protein LOC100905896 [Galendromus occidentalis]|uniref:Uncharacterized protein LOC100905896 n=1 Tax=Galendromus occidentalis TaxID=34638 RepID=A0AAJ6VV90_9ACAR|nr:uncharacterized protein LOC100905896 [Galendromus occidentalis]